MIRTVATLCLLLLAAPLQADDGPAEAWSHGLGASPDAVMGFLLEVTFMKIDVADIEVRMDAATTAAVTAVQAEGKKNDDRRDRVAALLHAADTVAYGMTFRRDADQGKFLKGVFKNLENARKAGEITAEEHDRVCGDILNLLSPHTERGGRKGDRMLFRIDGETARFSYLGFDGEVLADRTHDDEVFARAFRSLHTGEKSKLRKKLGELPWRRD